MNKIRIKIGEREIPLRFTMREFGDIEEAIGNLGEIRKLILEDKKRSRNLVAVLRILGNAGLKAEGKEQDITDDWLLETMDPHLLMAYQLAVLACMSRDTESEAAKEENESKERDLVLEEINEKKERVNTPSAG